MKTRILESTAALSRRPRIAHLFCTGADLAGVVAPWLAAGLGRGEACAWLTGPPLREGAARRALEAEAGDLAPFLASGRLEVFDARTLSRPSGRLDPGALERDRRAREARAREGGLPGVRIAVNLSGADGPKGALRGGFPGAGATADGQYVTAIYSFPEAEVGAIGALGLAGEYPALLIPWGGGWRLLETEERNAPGGGAEPLSDSMWRAAFDAMGESVMVVDREHIILEANGITEQLLGLSARELIGRRCYEVVHEMESPPAYCPLELLKESERHEDVEIFLPESGRWVRIAVDPIFDDAGNLAGAVHVIRDVTRRKTLEAKLLVDERRYHDMVACSPYAIVIHSEGIIRYANRAAVELVGACDPGELVGRRVLDFSPPEMREIVTGRIMQLLSGETRRVGLIEERLVRIDGREIDVEAAATAMSYDDEPAVQVFLHDITERREAARVIRSRGEILAAVGFAAERFLRETSWRESIDAVLRRLGEAVGVGRVYLFENHVGPGGEFLTSQRHEWAAPGVEPQIDNADLQGVPWRAGGFERWVETLGAGEEIHGHVRDFPEEERALLDPQGILSIAVVPILADDRWWGFMGFDECVRAREWSAPERNALRLAADILGAAIERERADAERRELRDWQSGTLEALPDLLFEIDGEGRFYHSHAPDPRRLYLPPDRFIGRRVDEVLPPEASGIIMEAVGRATRTGRDTGTVYSLEVEGEVRWFELSIGRKGPPTGTEERFIALARDITERKRAESVKDDFVSTVSHELRTPLSAIHAAVRLLEKGIDDPRGSARLIDIACRNSERLVRLIEDLLDVQKIETGRMRLRLEPVDLGDIVRQCLEENEPYARRFGVELRLDTPRPGEDLQIRCDPDRIRQVLTNLLSNAAKYSPGGGTVEVSAGRRDGVVRVSVRDHGAGIPESFRDHVFERFSRADSTMSRERGGTGLGLNIARSIVEMHGGQIDFETKRGEGTTFHFDLPL